ncbi:hypothetical protein [Streptomyces sp. NBC_00687]|uniref:hypothetical protein n=1 Tax=Streptomyces sp. NBC_00687 TaxID=2975807 RepID=UPI00224EDB7D|nr:hypothetical protein [Streptomyces sp. NBC_00687]MCX4920055.1 hypothetical protein [Streptomyces sp. NBC_00687]
MTTPAPKENAAPADAPFDPLAFPKDLLDAQLREATLYAELHALQTKLPWSREPHEGWPDDKERKRAGRPATEGWSEEEAAAYDELWVDLRKATAVVQGHAWWDRCESEGIKGGALVAARMTLKHADGAVPASLQQADVEAAA